MTTVISSHVKDKNRIFTGYKIFVTAKILVFHRCLYNNFKVSFATDGQPGIGVQLGKVCAIFSSCSLVVEKFLMEKRQSSGQVLKYMMLKRQRFLLLYIPSWCFSTG